MNPEFLINETKTPKDKHGFTLAIMFSRMWLLRSFFDAFNKLEIPMEDCHLLIVDNSDLAPLGKTLKNICEGYVGYFRSVRLYKTYREGGKCIIGGKHQGICDTKLPPIILGYLDIARLTTTDVLINIEDDTLAPKHAIMKLLENFDNYGSNTFISGIESNRGDDMHLKTRLGVYWVRSDDKKLMERVSLSPKCKGIVEVDACGHFCFITTRELFHRGFINMYQFLNKSGHFAPDTYHTYNLKTQGVKILADFDIPCIHLHPTPMRILKWTPGKAVSTLDYYIKEWKHWAMPTGLTIDVKKKPEWW